MSSNSSAAANHPLDVLLRRSRIIDAVAPIPRRRAATLRAALLAFIASLYLPLANATDSDAAADCATLRGLRLSGATVVSADFVEAGAFKTAGGKSLPGQNAFCRVLGSATPSDDSNIRFEVWLPAAGWNGRLWGVGNGDYAGSISQPALNARMGEGFAAVGTDTGHQTNDPGETQWAIGHPQQVIDFGHRGIHEAAVNAKRIVTAFYGRAPAHAYFASCSNGGRQALMEAQRYPDDYDGLIAGAPAHEWTAIYIGSGEWQFHWFADPAHRIPATKLPALRAAVANACDALDGVSDGVIENPPQCRFDPAVLACHGAETNDCLTESQLATVRGLYAGNVSADGHPLLRGYAIGSEDGLEEVTYVSAPGSSDGSFEALNPFWRDLVFENPSWDYRTFDLERDGALAKRKLAPVLDADDPDLTHFSARGGKLIVFHGWADPLPPPAGSIDYVERVARTMGAERADRTVRLFMAPGMGHCAGGDGPNRFGQFGVGDGNPETNLGAALQRWVEQGAAPDRVIATKRKDDGDATSDVLRTRPLCAYPKVARYIGRGSTDDAANFVCAAPR
jgi:hypothetical protein